MELIKPKRLNQGDTIAVISPSSGIGSIFSHRVENGVRCLENLGFKVKVYPTVSKFYHGSAGTPEERTQDIHDAFCDPDVSAIIATIGGITLNEVIPLLDYSFIRNNPKIFCGYSDNTLLHCALLSQAGLVSFYGPGVANQFGEFPAPHEYTIKHFLRALCTDSPLGNISASEEWTEELLEWADKSDLTRPRTLVKNSDAHVCLKEGKSSGRAIIGCLPSLLQLIGSKYSPIYDGSILFIESPEGEDYTKGQPLSYIDSNLANLRLHGVFDKIAGLVIGRAFGHSGSAQDDLFAAILRQTRGFDFPVLANVNFGHTDPMLTLPLSIPVELNATKGTLSFLESGVVS
jgi:muramoyltetrapeptide carboxypeptidase